MIILGVFTLIQVLIIIIGIYKNKNFYYDKNNHF